MVYEISPDGQETVLHNFAGGGGGSYPQLGVVLDSLGNIYGATGRGGAMNEGVVYELMP
jgi:hypothetical protein